MLKLDVAPLRYLPQHPWTHNYQIANNAIVKPLSTCENQCHHTASRRFYECHNVKKLVKQSASLLRFLQTKTVSSQSEASNITWYQRVLEKLSCLEALSCLIWSSKAVCLSFCQAKMAGKLTSCWNPKPSNLPNKSLSTGLVVPKLGNAAHRNVGLKLPTT